MRKYWILTKIQLLSLYGINKIRFSKDAEERKKSRRSILLLVVVLVCFGNLSVVYGGQLAVSFKAVDALPVMLCLMAAGASGFALMMSVFSAKGMLVGFGDFDAQMAWPVTVRQIAASRVTALYVYNLFYTLPLLLPAGVIYALHAQPPVVYYALYLILAFFVPLIPTALGGLAGLGVTAVTAGMKRNAMIGTVLQMVLMLGIMAISMQSGNALQSIGEVADSVNAGVRTAYAPAGWFADAVNGAVLPGLLLVLVSVAAIAALCLAVAAALKPLHARLSVGHRSEKYRFTAQHRTGALPALYKKELKRYFASTIYVTNTAVGAVLLLGLSVTALFAHGVVDDLLGTAGLDASALLPFVMALFVSMSATTGSSISLEGRNLWIVKSLPIPARMLFLSKILVSLTVSVPASLVSAMLLGLAFKVRGIGWLYLFVTPVIYACFAAVCGLILNLKLPRFDWRSEAEVVKQGAAPMLMILGTMALSILPVLLASSLGGTFVLPGASALLAILCAVGWRFLMSKGDEALRRL